MSERNDVRARVLAAAASETYVPIAALRRRNAALVVTAILIPAALFAASGGVRGGPRPVSFVIDTALGAALLALTTLVVALGRGHSTLGRSSSLLLGVALVAPFALFAWKCGVSAPFPDLMAPSPDRPGFRCLQLSCALSAWPLVALLLARRGTDPVHPRATGAAIGAAVGACSWVLVDLWCSVAYVPHLLLGHVLPVVVCTIAGAALGDILALRRRD
jgi:hypothetical protein